MPAFVPAYVPQTEIDAVNQMLASIGQSPVQTIENSTIKDVNLARTILHNSLREILTKGWNFNTDSEWELTRDANNKVAIPANALSIDPCDTAWNLVERYDDGTRRFYDKDERTFVLEDDVEVNVTWFFPFEEIPQAARAYIAHHAGRVFQTSSIGSQILHRFTQERENELLGELQREDKRSRNTNIFAQNTTTGRIVQRNR